MDFSLTNGESIKGVHGLCNVSQFFLSKTCICHMTNLRYTPRRDKNVFTQRFSPCSQQLYSQRLESWQSPSTGERIKGVQYVCTVEYPAIKKTNSGCPRTLDQSQNQNIQIMMPESRKDSAGPSHPNFPSASGNCT